MFRPGKPDTSALIRKVRVRRYVKPAYFLFAGSDIYLLFGFCWKYICLHGAKKPFLKLSPLGSHSSPADCTSPLDPESSSIHLADDRIRSPLSVSSKSSIGSGIMRCATSRSALSAHCHGCCIHASSSSAGFSMKAATLPKM